jgi:hypothetical protein
METKYSKEKFEGFTHRFKVQFEIGEPYFSSLDIYSNSDSYQKCEDFINEKKNEKVLSFKIIYRASKKQDEMSAKFIDEMLSGI